MLNVFCSFQPGHILILFCEKLYEKSDYGVQCDVYFDQQTHACACVCMVKNASK